MKAVILHMLLGINSPVYHFCGNFLFVDQDIHICVGFQDMMQIYVTWVLVFCRAVLPLSSR